MYFGNIFFIAMKDYVQQLFASQAPYTQDNSSFCNKSWSELFQRTGILPKDLWTEESVRICIKTACPRIAFAKKKQNIVAILLNVILLTF